MAQDIPWEIQVARKRVPGWSLINKFGASVALDTADPPADVWDGGGTLGISTTPNITKVASTSNSDTGKLLIEGLIAGYGLHRSIITLTGQTVVTLETPFIFVHRMENIGSVPFVGDINVATSAATFTNGVPNGNLRAKITAGKNQTLMAAYMIPANNYGYITKIYASLDRTGDRNATLSLRVIPFGSTARLVKHTLAINGTGSSSYQKDFEYPDRIQPKSVIIFMVESVSANATAVSAGFNVLLEQIGIAE